MNRSRRPLVDRAQPTTKPHRMRRRNGDAVAERLRQSSLFDAGLDLAATAGTYGRTSGG